MSAKSEKQTAWASFCEKCNSTNLQVLTESTVSGGHSSGKSCLGFLLFGPLGLLCGNKKLKTDHKSFWACSNCGNKFRNIHEVLEETAATKKATLTSSIIWAVVTIFAFILLSGSFYILAIIPIIMLLVNVIRHLTSIKDLKFLTSRSEEISSRLAATNKS